MRQALDLLESTDHRIPDLVVSHKLGHQLLCWNVCLLPIESIGGSRGHARRRPPSHPRDPILSFSYTFSLKSACVRGPCPRNGSTPPPPPPPWEILDLPLESIHDRQLFAIFVGTDSSDIYIHAFPHKHTLHAYMYTHVIHTYINGRTHLKLKFYTHIF